jgi:hypothetical protein
VTPRSAGALAFVVAAIVVLAGAAATDADRVLPGGRGWPRSGRVRRRPHAAGDEERADGDVTPTGNVKRAVHRGRGKRERGRQDPGYDIRRRTGRG